MTKLIQYLGIFCILSFSAISIFFAISERDIQDMEIKKLFAYTTFFEDRFYDIRMKQTLNPESKDERIVLANIFDATINGLGEWPLRRQTWAKMLEKLQHYGAKVVAFDVFYPEPSLVCNGENPDKIFAESIREFQSVPGNKVILPYALTRWEEDGQELPEVLYNFIMDTKQGEGISLSPWYVGKEQFPIPALQETDALLTHLQVESDSDGVFRHYPLVGNVDDIYFPSFSLAAYEAYTGDKASLDLLNIGDFKLKIKHGNLNLNIKGEAKIRWLGDQFSFPQFSIIKLLQSKDDDPTWRKLLENKIIFVGSTAFAAHDIRHTPVDPLLPGAYFHMNMTHMLMEGIFFAPYEESTKYSWLILILGTLLILVIQLYGNALLDLFSVLAISSGVYYLDTFHLLPKGYEIKLFFCLFSIGSCYSWNTFLHFYLANKDKAFLKNAFGNYISPELIDEMYETNEAPKLGGDSGIRSAYFTDIQGFSSFSEKLSATQLVELLNEYLTAMTDILLEEKGTLDKYEGDAIIAFYGAPMPLPDHAEKACLTAHRMQEALLVLREKWVSEGDKWPLIVHEMRMRIGINTGEIVTGNMGSASRLNYTMMGDAVNLAARLEESAKQYGIFTQVSKETMEAAGSEIFIWRELDTIKVVGKSIPVTTFELVGIHETAPDYLKELAVKFKEGIEAYKAQKWDEALALFKHTLELEYQRFPLLRGVKTNPSEIYIERCEAFKENPPGADWDGVFTLTSK